jgi:hypothetical protein
MVNISEVNTLLLDITFYLFFFEGIVVRANLKTDLSSQRNLQLSEIYDLQ